MALHYHSPFKLLAPEFYLTDELLSVYLSRQLLDANVHNQTTYFRLPFEYLSYLENQGLHVSLDQQPAVDSSTISKRLLNVHLSVDHQKRPESCMIDPSINTIIQSQPAPNEDDLTLVQTQPLMTAGLIDDMHVDTEEISSDHALSR